MKLLKRLCCGVVALLLCVMTPVGDYLYVRDVMPVYASGAAMTAFQWIWAAILAACGVTTTDPISIDNIADGVSRWVDSLTDEVHKAEYKLLLESMQKATWGFELRSAYDIVQMVKLYLKTIDGYGTDSGIISLPMSVDAFRNSYSYKYGVNPSSYNSMLSSDCYILSVDDSLPEYNLVRERDYFHMYSDFIRMGAFKKGTYSIDVYRYTVNNEILYSKVHGIMYDKNGKGTYISNTVPSNNDGITYDATKGFAIPVYETREQLNEFLRTGVIGDTINNFTGSFVEDIPVESKTEVQARPIQQAGALRVPATMEEAYAQYIDFTGATTPDELVTALNPSWDITYGKDDTQTGDKDDTFPWVPDITGAMDAIRDVINSVKEDVKAIPGALSGIKDNIVALPETISQAITDAISESVVGDFSGNETSSFSLPAELFNKFPFCIPFDLYSFVAVLASDPVAPRFEIPFVIDYEYLKYEHVFVFDLSVWEPAFVLLRTLETLLFLVGLAMVTRNIIRG